VNVLVNGIGFETVQGQAPTGVNEAGKPTYGSQTAFKARVVREEKVARLADGSEIATMATLWEDALGSQSVIPVEEWRLTLSDGLIGIVVERMEGRTLGGVLDHVRLRLRRE